jgi:hypothetical protein
MELYIEVLRHVFKNIRQLMEPLSGTAEERLRQHVSLVIRHVSDPQKPAWHSILFARELAEPTTALNWMAEVVAPGTHRLVAIIRELSPPTATDHDVVFATYTIIAQCLFFTKDRSLMQILYPKLDVLHDPEKLADRIVDSALRAICGRGRRRGKTAPSASPE